MKQFGLSRFSILALLSVPEGANKLSHDVRGFTRGQRNHLNLFKFCTRLCQLISLLVPVSANMGLGPDKGGRLCVDGVESMDSL